MNSQDARQAFKEAGLTYQKIKEADIKVLRAMLALEYLKASINRELETNSLNVEDYRYTPKLDGSMEFAKIYINSMIFKSKKDLITFYEDGHIKFCEWASEANKAPALRAFVKWTKLIGDTK